MRYSFSMFDWTDITDQYDRLLHPVDLPQSDGVCLDPDMYVLTADFPPESDPNIRSKDHVSMYLFQYDPVIDRTHDVHWECMSGSGWSASGEAYGTISAFNDMVAVASDMSIGRERRTALWTDVQQKAYRLMQNNDIEIQSISTYSILCEVAGDTDVHSTYVNNDARVSKDNSISAANWYCTCPWGQWCNTGRRPHDGPESTGTVKSNNRMCSHAYAAYLMLQQYRKMHKDQMKDVGEEDLKDLESPGNDLWDETDTFGDTSYDDSPDDDLSDSDESGMDIDPDDDELDHWYD